MELTGLRKIAEGGQAVIYDYGEGKILRVMRNPEDKEMLLGETRNLEALFKLGVPVPEVFGVTEADGRPALIMQKIDGVSMLDMIQKNPFGIKKYASMLADIQVKTAAFEAPEGIISSVKRTLYFLDRSPLSEELKGFISGLIESLPEGKALLHGDFQPGNILISGGKAYLIDWAGVTKGEIISDIAHTYLLMRNVPKIPGMPGLIYAATRILGKRFGKSYLKSIREKVDFDTELFSKWICVHAMERLCFGHPSEKEKLLGFITKCAAQKDNIRDWYKMV